MSQFYILILILIILYSVDKYFHIKEKNRLEEINDKLLDRLYGQLEEPYKQSVDNKRLEGKSPLNALKKEKSNRN